MWKWWKIERKNNGEIPSLESLSQPHIERGIVKAEEIILSGQFFKKSIGSVQSFVYVCMSFLGVLRFPLTV